MLKLPAIKSKFIKLKRIANKPILNLPGENLSLSDRRIKIFLTIIIGLIPAGFILLSQIVPTSAGFLDVGSKNFLNFKSIGNSDGSFDQPTSAVQLLATHVDSCDKVAKEQRFSCFRSAVENYYQGKPADDNFALESKLNFHSDDASYAIFGTNCHTYYHALGDYIAPILPLHLIRLIS